MSLYELVQDEAEDPAARRAAAEALVRAGLLRRERAGPSPMFIWLASLTLVIVAVGAAQSVGAWAVAVFVAGAGALAVALVVLRRRGEENVYIGPTGERIHLGGSPAAV
jgi:Flp pilus assembly protein TadB